MNKITLKTEEHLAISKIVDKYRTLETDLTTVQAELQLLDSKKTQLLKTLDKIRSEELTFFKKLKRTYGDGKLDILTMEYVTENLKISTKFLT
jgi:hypothetical protein